MTIKEAYKEGFAEELAARGLVPSKIDEALAKQADDTAGSKLMSALLLSGLSLPVIAGWGLGATKRTSKSDLKALTDMALLKDYQAGIRQLKSNREKKKTEDRLEKAPLLKANAAVTKTPGTIANNIEQAKQKVRKTGLPAEENKPTPTTVKNEIPKK